MGYSNEEQPDSPIAQTTCTQPESLNITRPASIQLGEFPPDAEWERGIKIFTHSNEPPVILVDMDNTLVNWELQFERLMAKHHPQIPIIPPVERKQFKIELNYHAEFRAPILHLTSLDKFWLSMDPNNGAINALKEMIDIGAIVFIVTTPDEKHTARSSYEKIKWVEKHFGCNWKYRTILTQDKTLIRGDILIDDKPSASVGLLQPSWTHILYAQPYNAELSCPRLTSWNEWGPTLYRVLVERASCRRNFGSNLKCYTIADAMRSQFQTPKLGLCSLSKANSKIDSNLKECCSETEVLSSESRSVQFEHLSSDNEPNSNSIC